MNRYNTDLPTAAVMRKLITIRQGRGLTAAHIAMRMDTTVSNVENFEWRTTSGGRDIRVSTLIRYMRAIGVRLALQIDRDS